jgi:hypothetical protein
MSTLSSVPAWTRSSARFVIAACVLLLQGPAAAQTTVTWFSGGSAFAPPVVNREEATVGIVQHFGDSRLDVAVGNAFDVIRWSTPDRVFAWGPDLFIFAMSRNISGFRLKIAAADGYFGMHFSMTVQNGWQFRFRVLHFSAHLVDGLYDLESQTWLDGKEPFPFSRNFGELMAAREWTAGPLAGRFWSALSGSVFTKPDEIQPWSGNAGIEAFTCANPHFYAAYQCGLLGVPEYSATHSVHVGVKFGDWYGSGLRLFVQALSGLEPFGEYYSSRARYVGIGFAFDYW